MTDSQSVALFNAITDYDRRQSRAKHYNRFALGHYAAALGRVKRHCANGIELRTAIVGSFNGKLADKLLKAVGLPLTTREEQFWPPRLPELDEE